MTMEDISDTELQDNVRTLNAQKHSTLAVHKTNDIVVYDAEKQIRLITKRDFEY